MPTTIWSSCRTRSNWWPGFAITPEATSVCCRETRPIEELAQSRQHMAEQLEAGRKYLQALLPEPIESPVAVRWCYVPSADLGGDTFGYYWIDEDHFVLYLIDVVGHGLDSALLSVTLMNVLRSRALADTDFCEPGQVLKALNDAFPMEEYGEKCFTMWYGVYQPSTSTLAWSGGGHPEALLFDGDTEQRAEPVRLESQGPMIGMMPCDEFESGRCQVKSRIESFRVQRRRARDSQNRW